MKRCTACGIEKPLEMFAIEKRHSDGRTSKCKACRVLIEQARYAVKSEEILAKRRTARAADPEKERAYRLAKRQAHRERINEQQRESYRRNAETRKRKIRDYQIAHPDRGRARAAVGRALERGDLTRKPCEKCGATKTEAHHPDYSKPLDVTWLCRTHHKRAHMEPAVAQQLEAISDGVVT